jgi:hypothetical protein
MLGHDNMIGFIFMIASMILGLSVWLFGMRPHLIRHRGFAITGASYGLSAWGDWQECRDLARSNGDIRAARLSTAFMLTQIGFIVGLAFMLLGL